MRTIKVDGINYRVENNVIYQEQKNDFGGSSYVCLGCISAITAQNKKLVPDAIRDLINSFY